MNHKNITTAKAIAGNTNMMNRIISNISKRYNIKQIKATK